MIKEIQIAANHVSGLLLNNGVRNQLTYEQIRIFRETLTNSLAEKFKGHWHADALRGSAFRCLWLNFNRTCECETTGKKLLRSS
jgi:hypothetical protein